jgi:uncharacterized protein DUF6532
MQDPHDVDMTDKRGMYRNSIIQYLLSSQWFAKEKSHRRSHDFEGQTMLPLVTLAFILTAVCIDSSFIDLSLNLNGHGTLLGWMIRFRVQLKFGKLVRRFRVNSTASHIGRDITNISRNLPPGRHSVQNPARLIQQVVRTFALNCARICFGIPGMKFLLHSTYTSEFIDSFFSAFLPTVAQPSATTEVDDEAAMMVEFDTNFS